MTGSVPDRMAVIAAHPDDEVMGFGGTLARFAAAGTEARVLILATGLASRGNVGKLALDKLRDDSRRAADILGVANLEFADFPDNRMDTVALLDVVQRVEAFLDGFAADQIYTHHAGDLNVDHRITQAAVLAACRPLPGRGPQAIFAGEVSSATEWGGSSAVPFVPTDYIDIAETLERKLAAMQCYGSELRPWPHPRSLEALAAQARNRGSQCGRAAAEAFITLRRVT